MSMPGRTGSLREKWGISSPAIAMILVLVGVVVLFRSHSPDTQELESRPSSSHTTTSFLVRDGKFDCTTIYDQVPIGVLQQIPGMINSRLVRPAANGSTLPGGKSSCSLSFIATGDADSLDAAVAAANSGEGQNRQPPFTNPPLTLRNTLNELGLPNDYRSFVLNTSRNCSLTSAASAIEKFPSGNEQEWVLFQTTADDLGIAYEAIRHTDDQLGCITAVIAFPEGAVSPKQSQLSREFLKKFAAATSRPLADSVSAAKEPNMGDNAPQPEPTFIHNGVLDCRAYIFNATQTQQRQVGIVSDYARIPGDFIASLMDARETPLYKISRDGSSVTCWFTADVGESALVSTGLFNTVPVTAIATSPDSDFVLPKSVPAADAVPGVNTADSADALRKWHYFLHLPGRSAPLSRSHSATLEIETTTTPTLNFYRCAEKNNSKDETDDTTIGRNCLILSAQISSSLTPAHMKLLAQFAQRVDSHAV